jgi:hypothetical protein
MKIPCAFAGAAPAVLTAAALLVAQGVRAETGVRLVRETQRQQSAAERASCAGVQRGISTGTDAVLVVRTAIELGYNSCQVIRCALEGKALTDKRTHCEKVVRGAIAAGVSADVVSRCATDSCDPDAIAAILADTLLEPNYCYLFPRPPAAPEPPQRQAVIDRQAQPPQASPHTFP